MTKYLHFNHTKDSTKATLKILKKYNLQSRTVVVDLPTYDEVLSLAMNYIADATKDTFNLTIGVTLLSFKDKYIKSIGRKEADIRKKVAELKIDKILVASDKIRIFVKSYEQIELELVLDRVKKTRNIYGTIEGSEDFYY